MNFFVHPLGCCESKDVGAGTRVWAYAHVLPGARIGADCNICDQVFIENDVVVGDRVTVKCGVQLWDGLRIEDDVFIGPNATFTNDRFPRSKQYPETFAQTVRRARRVDRRERDDPARPAASAALHGRRGRRGDAFGAAASHRGGQPGADRGLCRRCEAIRRRKARRSRKRQAWTTDVRGVTVRRLKNVEGSARQPQRRRIPAATSRSR